MNQFKIYLPPPTNWQDFQSLVRALAEARYKASSVVEYGRLGQRQNGVDVFAEDRSDDKKIGLQCKESKKGLTEKEIRREADEATGFRPSLDLFIVATTAPIDAKLQAAVIKLNDSKVYPFTIRVEFWNDLVNDINRYAMVLNDCYQTYRQAFQQSDEGNHLACLRVAFDRPAYKDDFTHERNYDDFEEALVSTKRLFRTGFSIDRLLQFPVVQTIPLEFLPDGPYRKQAAKLEAHVEKIYKSYIADKKKILSNPSYAHDRAGHYNILRRDLLNNLNAQLDRSGLPRIDFDYA